MNRRRSSSILIVLSLACFIVAVVRMWGPASRADSPPGEARKAAPTDLDPATLVTTERPGHRAFAERTGRRAASRDLLDVADESDFRASITMRSGAGEFDGVESILDEGSLEILLADDAGGLRAVTTVDGRWAGALDASRRYEVRAVSANGAAFDFQDPGPIDARAPDVEVVVRPVEHWTVEARDAETQLHLESVTIVVLADAPGARSGGGAPARAPVTGAQVADGATWRIVEAQAQSPVKVRDAAKGGRFRVQAEGYAPREVLRSASQRLLRVELARAGTLEVRASARLYSTRQQPSVVVRGDGGSVVSRRALQAPGPLRIEGLPAGAYFIAVETLVSDEVLHRACEASAEVLPGEVTVIELPSPEHRDPSVVRIAAALPSDLGRSAPWSVSVRPLDRQVRRASSHLGPLSDWQAVPGTGLLESSPLELQPGRYEAVVAPLGRAVPFEVARPDERILLELTDVAAVSVRVERPGGGPAEDVVVEWSYLDPPGGPHRLRLGDASNPATFHCDPRAIRLQAIGPGSLSESVEVEPRPGQRLTRSLSLRPQGLPRLRLVLWNGAGREQLSAAGWSSIRARPSGGSGRMVEVRFGRGSAAQYGESVGTDWSEAELVFDRPGSYRIELPSCGLEFDALVASVPGRRDVIVP